MKKYLQLILTVFLLCQSAVVQAENPLQQDIREINDTMRGIYETTVLSLQSDCPFPELEFTGALDRLIARADDIILEQKRAAGYGEKAYDIVLRDIQMQRSAAFLHAWAVFTSQLKQRICPATTTSFREPWLGLDRDSVLHKLLVIYGQIYASAVQDKIDHLDAPLSVYFPRTDQLFYLSQRLYAANFIPSTAHLIGNSADEFDVSNNYISLWAIVNYQNDKLRGTSDSEVFEWGHVTPLIAWLGQATSETSPLMPFANSAEEMPVFFSRLKKLELYCSFRKWVADEDNLVNMLAFIQTNIAKGKITWQGDAIDDENFGGSSSMWEVLTTAAGKDDQGEFLPDAAIWLRYILLLSYQGAGGNQILTPDANISTVFQGIGVGLPLFFEKVEDCQKKLNPRNTPRWHQYPARSGFNCLVDDVTRGSLHMLYFQQWICSQAEKESNESQHVAFNNFKQQFDGYLWNEWNSTIFPDYAGTEEVIRIKSDYDDFAQMSANLLKFYESKQKLDEHLTNLTGENSSRFLRQEANLKQLALAYPELSGCNPFSIPTQTYNQHTLQLKANLEKLRKHLAKLEKDYSLREGYIKSQSDNAILKLETLAANFSYLAVDLAVKQAKLEMQIAENCKEIQRIRQEASNHLVLSASNKEQARNLESEDLAAGHLAYAKGMAETTKQNMEQMREAIKDAQAKMEALKETLHDYATKWQKEIDEAEKAQHSANIIRVCNTAIAAVATIVTYGAASPWLAAAIAGGAALNDAAVDIYMGKKYGDMSTDEVWLRSLAATTECVQISWSAYNATLRRIATTGQAGEPIIRRETGSQIINRTLPNGTQESILQSVIREETIPQKSSPRSSISSFEHYRKAASDILKAAITLRTNNRESEIFGQLIGNQVRPEIIAAINSAIWQPGSEPLGTTIGPIVKNESLNSCLWEIMETGGLFAFTRDNPTVSRIINEFPREEHVDKFTRNLEGIFVQIEVEQASQLGFETTRYEFAINGLKRLLLDDKQARDDFWSSVTYDSLLIPKEENDKKIIAILHVRLDRFQAGCREGYFQTVLKTIRQIDFYNIELNQAVERAKNPSELHNVAEITLPDTVEKLDGLFISLDNTLAEALNTLRENETKAEVAYLVLLAASYDLKAAELEEIAKSGEVFNADIDYERAAYRLEEQELKKTQAGLDLHAKQANLHLSDYLLRNAHRRVMLLGNEDSRHKATIALSGIMTASIDESCCPDPYTEALLGRVCQDYCGMLRWMNLFNVKQPDSAREMFDSLLIRLQQRNQAGTEQTCDAVEKDVETIKEKINERFAKRDSVDFKIESSPIKKSWIKFYKNDRQIEDFEDDPLFVAWFKEQKESSVRDLPIARIDFEITGIDLKFLKEEIKREVGNNILWFPDHKYDHIVWIGQPNLIRIVGDSPNLSFSLRIPNDNSMQYPGPPILSLLEFTHPDSVMRYDEINTLLAASNKAFEGIANSLSFCGIYGTWRFYIFSAHPSVTAENCEEKILKLHVQIPFIKIAP